MFNLWKKKPRVDTTSIVNRLEDMVHNAVGRLSWHDIFGNFKESELRGDKSQLGLSAVYCALNMYLGAVIGLPRLTQRLDPATGLPLRYVKTTEHPAARIWNHYANDDMDSDELLKRIIYDMLYADGNFYALPEYDQMGRISRCYYIHPTRVPRGNIRRSEGHEVLTIRGGVRRAIKGELIYLVMSGDTTDEAVMLSARDIIHLKGPIPDSEYHRSMGILENNARSAGLYDSAEQMGEQFYRKGATNQMFLSTESKLDPKFQKEMEELFNGEGVRGRSLEDLFTTRILSNGLKPVHVGMTPEVMKFIETRAFSVEDVARWFSIPPSLLHSVMGTGGSEDSDKAMVLWIQTGLGNLLSNIERQFRNNFLPRASQTTFSFVFYRLHLYKTVINEFSQAIRNFFEIGALDRLAIADLIGIHLDPSDKSNTQRYVPANIITTNHSASLEKKAKTSLAVMDQQLIKMQQDLEQSAESFKTSQEIAKNPPESTSDDIPKEPPSDVPNPAEDKPPSEDNSDKKTRPTVPRLDNVARTALYNVIKGLHDFETKVLKQKKESRPNLKEAMNEWYPKLKVTIRTAISPWNTVLETMREELLLREGHEVEDFVDNWEATSRLSLMDLFPEESLESKFSNTFGFLKETKDDSSGS
jgi:HK97 family phage portal protein